MEKLQKTSDNFISVLSSVKKLIGIMEEDNSFDMDIIFNINAALSVLYQLGVLDTPYSITSVDDTYEDILPNASNDIISLVKMYLYYKTKLGFDSSTLSSNIIESLKQMINETEYRLMISYNPKNTFDNNGYEDSEDKGDENSK